MRRRTDPPDHASRRGFELQPLTAINDVFRRLAAGQVASRVVLDFA